MNNTKRFLILLGIILTILMCNIYFKSNEKEISTENAEEISMLKEDILSSEIENYDKDKLISTEEKILEIINMGIIDEKILAECYFILGNICMQNNDNDEAIKHFNNFISYFNGISQEEVKIKTYYELSKAYLNESKYEKSEEVFNSLKTVSTSDNAKKEIIKYSLLRSADIFYYPKGKSTAVEILEDALKLAKEVSYEYMEDVYFELGKAYWYEDRLVESINTKLEALSIARGKNIESKMAEISIDIGIDYLHSRNYEEAVTYLTRVLTYKLKDEEKSPEIKSSALLNLIECYIKLEKYDSAEESIAILDRNIRNIKDENVKEYILTLSYINKADLQTEQGNPLDALKLLNSGKISYENDESYRISNIDIRLYEEYGDAYYKLNDYSKALANHKKCESLVLQRDLSYLEEVYNEKIYLDYKSMGDYDNTILYLEKNIELKNKLAKDKNRQYSQYLINEFESEKNLEKISELEESRNRMLLLFTILCIAITTISIFLYYIYRQNKEINRLNKLFKNLSVTDALTKVHNRRALDEFLAGNWALYKKTEMPISFMMIDLDFFKLYNDNYGHPKGDLVLEKVATEIKKSCRKVDFVARYGGEEFIVIMLNADKNEAINLAERISKNIYERNIAHEYSIISDRITISTGITTAYIGTNKNYDEYIEKADEALYKAKAKGKNTYVYLD